MDDLVERLIGVRDNHAMMYGDYETVTEAAARMQALETSLAEAEGRVVAEVVAWLREEGRWIVDTYDADHPHDISEALATALETGEWKK